MQIYMMKKERKNDFLLNSFQTVFVWGVKELRSVSLPLYLKSEFAPAFSGSVSGFYTAAFDDLPIKHIHIFCVYLRERAF